MTTNMYINLGSNTSTVYEGRRPVSQTKYEIKQKKKSVVMGNREDDSLAFSFCCCTVEHCLLAWCRVCPPTPGAIHSFFLTPSLYSKQHSTICAPYPNDSQQPIIPSSVAGLSLVVPFVSSIVCPYVSIAEYPHINVIFAVVDAPGVHFTVFVDDESQAYKVSHIFEQPLTLRTPESLCKKEYELGGLNSIVTSSPDINVVELTVAGGLPVCCSTVGFPAPFMSKVPPTV